MTKTLLLISVLILPFVVAACGGKHQTSAPTSRAMPDIYNYLRKPGKITHVRYTSYTPPWPTRTEAWIDWDNNRVRSWNVQWTDSPTNPSVCTSIRNGDDWYPCLPSSEKLEPKNFAHAYAFWPRIPLRASDSELSLALPDGATPTDGADGSQNGQPVKIEAEATTRRDTQGDTNFLVNSWKISSDLGATCQKGQTGSAKFEYTSSEAGEPISEFITMTCGQETQRYLGVLYHEVGFVDRADLPQNFFDVDSTRSSLIADEMSSSAAQLGSAFWLGNQIGDWKLEGAEHDMNSATVTYSRGRPADRVIDNSAEPEVVELSMRTSAGIGPGCDGAELIPNDAYGGSLCKIYKSDDLYHIVWTPPGFVLWLDKRSYPEGMGRAEILALAAGLRPWEEKAVGPLLKADDVTNLVADSLEVVCPKKLTQIRQVRSSSLFSFDRKTGEWTGTFGAFGDYAVPDAKPVAIPVSQRKEVESTLSHNAAQFAGCAVDEQPAPQQGDDEFAIQFLSKDDSGFAFQITGVDSKVEAALSICLATNAVHCGLTDPGGASIGAGGVTIDDVRPKVLRIHLGLKADELNRTGTWTFALDLGDGRIAQATFDVR